MGVVPFLLIFRCFMVFLLLNLCKGTNLFLDPQIAEAPTGNTWPWARGNYGQDAIDTFWANHQCNDVCFSLGLNNRRPGGPVARNPTLGFQRRRN